jgi:probable rRNA maturation factor
MKKSVRIENKTDSSPLVVFHPYKTLSFPKNDIFSTAKRIYRKERLAGSQKTHVIFCSNRSIRKLNAMFRNKDSATDVLSFNYDEKDLLGEIYISLQRAKTQAKEYKAAYNEEVVRLFIHGMCHLLGFDHENEKDKKRMQKKENEFLKCYK